MRKTTSFNKAWTFIDGEKSQIVNLPHNAVDLPYDYCDDNSYQRPFRYRKELIATAEMLKKEVFLRFEGAMADAHILLNGAVVAAYSDGYTPFEARLTGGLKEGSNLVEVILSGAENPDIPPFGGTIDFLTYAGIYRDVWLVESDAVRIDNVKIETPGLSENAPSVSVVLKLANPQAVTIDGTISADILAPDGSLVQSKVIEANGEVIRFSFDGLQDIQLWELDDPALYTLSLELKASQSEDRVSRSFGFRLAEFRPEGFFLNGRKVKIVGLNRHQSFPNIGYALGRAAQEKDAEILKRDLGLNLVRTSHYPQSPWFLDHCDRIGLMVLEEIPGWQHIGGADWQDKTLENVRAMIERDWNHPSIILWGVRINESRDEHSFYSRTNTLAHELDGTRQTGGIRCIPNSEMLEDVYTMNDFVLGEEIMPGNNRGRVPLRDQREVTGLVRNVPYLVTEYGGHMYPTTVEDGEERQFEHVLRHLEVLNAAHGDDHIAGCIGWCFADYNTHKDFGAGDRICHHGVLNMYRQPKFAAYAYGSQIDPQQRIVMEPVSYWTMGNRSTGGVLPLMVLTNCDRVELVAGEKHMVGEPERERFPNLAHPPVIFKGNQDATNGFELWGAAFADVEFVGYINGEPVIRRKMACAPLPDRLEVIPDASTLQSDGSDCVRVSVRALDQAGNRMPFFQDRITVKVEGSVDLVGPSDVIFRGGYAAFWLRSSGRVDSSTVTVSSDRFASVSFAIMEEGKK
ncbi:glycoside hydrolase family 2 TIM barrel-domain containing protein [uncultured Cohaesibacter sp.]|uniref:glycoside hydrolase family 2 protein n=1 Tax=uncultured Cohaesibacter sp. TaxID=1002546 RepID=UPI00292EFDC1|nr:glycoside hydrolase family 2 TIM barrel-domain containing protein [uncultured Cohaesibacter sp.]